MSASTAKSPLAAAQTIVTELTGMAPEQQALALKFATETLGLKPTIATQTFAVQPATNSSQPELRGTLATGNSQDIKSFTIAKAPKSDQQFTAVVAYFYQFESRPEERKETIDAVVMKDAARLTGRPQVQQWNMTLNNAKRSGYLDTDGNGRFKLSSVGENLVAITLPGNGGVTKTMSKPAKKKARVKVAKKKSKKQA